MKNVLCLLAVCVLAAQAQAQLATANSPRTMLEMLESHTNALIVKGSAPIGAAGGVLIVAKESTDIGTGQKALGVAVVVRGSGVQDTSYVDYEELDSLLYALAQMNATPWSQTAMQQVEVSYTTRDGLRFASANISNTAGLQAVVQSTHACRVTACFDIQQLVLLRNLIDQAKGKLDAIPGAH